MVIKVSLSNLYMYYQNNMSKRDKKFWSSARRNRAAFDMYIERLTNIALSMYDWQNVPDSIDIAFLEKTLFYNGSITWFMDDVLGLLALPSTLAGRLNIYDIPVNRQIYATNGYHKKLNENNSVVMFNDMERNNTIHGVLYFADRLWQCDRTVDVNVNNQKTPKIILCSENQRLSVKNLFMQYEGNEPIIYGTNGLDMKNFSVEDIATPFVSDKVFDVRDRIWNDAMSYLGVPNTGMQKRERTNVEEISMGNGAVMGHRYSRLDMRQDACKKINKMFSTNIWVEYKDFRVPDVIAGATEKDGESL